MERLLWLLIGYLCGSFQSGYFLGKAKGLDVRNYGSHSTGATNSLRVMGTGAGILVLLLDAAKAIIPCVLARHFFRGQAELQLLMVLWTATGVMLGRRQGRCEHGRCVDCARLETGTCLVPPLHCDLLSVSLCLALVDSVDAPVTGARTGFLFPACVAGRRGISDRVSASCPV